MNINIFIQARTGSSRLPGKVLMPIMDRPMLAYLYQRACAVPSVSQVIVLTSRDREDDALANWCHDNAISCFRGALHDVLGRYQQASLRYPCDHLVRLTGDCPLIDPAVIASVIGQHLSEGNDYTSNCLEYTLPDGQDVEVVRTAALQRSALVANKATEREHVTLHIRNHVDRYRIGRWRYREDCSGMRWSVDYAEDFQLVSKIIQALYPGDPLFSVEDILDLLKKNPSWSAINSHIVINEGLAKSVREDRLVRVMQDGTVPELD